MMLIKTINDIELFKRKLFNEEPYRITYLFFNKLTNDCLYVGITEREIKGMISYIISSHHKIKKFKKNLDKYYLRILFPNDIPYIITNHYEGMFIGLFNTKLNLQKEKGAIKTFDKYKIPYLEDMKPKEEETINHINRCDLLEMFLQINHKDIYDKLYNMFHDRRTRTGINTKYDILKFCNFKDIVKSFNLINNNIKKKTDEIVYLFLKHNKLDVNLWTDRHLFISNKLVRNKERFGMVNKQYLWNCNI